jgi:hypothetical protein
MHPRRLAVTVVPRQIDFSHGWRHPNAPRAYTSGHEFEYENYREFAMAVRRALHGQGSAPFVMIIIYHESIALDIVIENFQMINQRRRAE